jgi:hypothetical protein
VRELRRLSTVCHWRSLGCCRSTFQDQLCWLGTRMLCLPVSSPCPALLSNLFPRMASPGYFRQMMSLIWFFQGTGYNCIYLLFPGPFIWLFSVDKDCLFLYPDTKWNSWYEYEYFVEWMIISAIQNLSQPEGWGSLERQGGQGPFATLVWRTMGRNNRWTCESGEENLHHVPTFCISTWKTILEIGWHRCKRNELALQQCGGIERDGGGRCLPCIVSCARH